MRRESGLTHFIYGEDTFFYTPLWRHPAQRLLATYHFEPDRLIQRVSPTAVKALDAVVLVGSNQLDYFRRFMSDERLHVVPHHVDTVFFRPGAASAESEETRVVFAGRGNRDFATLRKVIEIAIQTGCRLRFDLVLPDKNDHALFAGLAGTHCHRGLSDAELLALYQNAHLGLMPVNDCTANNSLLEMMACGLAVVGTHIGAMSEYANADGAILVKAKDPSLMFEALQALARDPAARQRMGAANRRRAVAEFGMDVTANRMSAVYRAVLSA